MTAKIAEGPSCTSAMAGKPDRAATTTAVAAPPNNTKHAPAAIAPAGASGPSYTKVANEMANTKPPNATVKPMPTAWKKPPTESGNSGNESFDVPLVGVTVVVVFRGGDGFPDSGGGLLSEAIAGAVFARDTPGASVVVVDDDESAFSSLEPSAFRRGDRRGSARSVPFADAAVGTRHRACVLDASRLFARGGSRTRHPPDPRRSSATARPQAPRPHADKEENPTFIGRAPRRAQIGPVGPRASPGARADADADAGADAGTGPARTAGGIVRNREARRAVERFVQTNCFKKKKLRQIDSRSLATWKSTAEPRKNFLSLRKLRHNEARGEASSSEHGGEEKAVSAWQGERRLRGV